MCEAAKRVTEQTNEQMHFKSIDRLLCKPGSTQNNFAKVNFSKLTILSRHIAQIGKPF